ncbi:hypothetical protein [Bacillus sp. CGMCC 1.16541]|uniref:hypothetical protein n=1 Tax=Bacillus sp. CGMCC 1.16541 TaxID=2185143 RepID=UPI000D73D636|nr:hypothetical protein [Bacillus sp. CGMCC 1.16541]
MITLLSLFVLVGLVSITLLTDALLMKTSMVDAFYVMFIEGKSVGKHYILIFTFGCLLVGMVGDWKRRKKRKNTQQG